MPVLYSLSELAATFIEGLTALFVAGSLCVPKIERKKYILVTVLSGIAYTALITLLNERESFSFVTLIVAIIFTFFMLLFISEGDIIRKVTSSMVTWFFIVAIDYVFTYSLMMIVGRSLDISKGFAIIMNPGTTRVIFILTDKLLQVLVFILCRKLYPKLHTLNRRNQVMVLIISTFSYIVMQILMGLAVSDSVHTLQIAVIFSLFFFIFSVVISVLAIAVSAGYQEKKIEAELISLSNSMLKKNYAEMHTAQNMISQQVHDFKNHLLTLNGMIEQDKSAKSYIADLVGSVYSTSKFCRCGNDTIDSIVNCKMNEAVSSDISFEFNIDLKKPISVSPADICAILANQLDNAIEACREIENKEKRSIKLRITQKESIIIFKTVNTVKDNPFINNRELKSTKTDYSDIHGYGIKNIKNTAEKYSGTVKNEFKDGRFISSVMISEIE